VREGVTEPGAVATGSYVQSERMGKYEERRRREMQ